MPDDRGTRYAVFLEDDPSLREIMVGLLAIAPAIRCYAFSSVSGFTSQPDVVLGSQVAILDINLGQDQPSGLDAFEWLRSHGYRGKIAFLTGHAHSNPLVSQAGTLKGVRVLEKPVGLDRLLDLFTENHQEGAET